MNFRLIISAICLILGMQVVLADIPTDRVFKGSQGVIINGTNTGDSSSVFGPKNNPCFFMIEGSRLYYSFENSFDESDMDTARYIEKDDLKQTSAGRGAAILENKTKKCTGILFNRRCEEVEIDLGYSRPTEEGSDEYLIFSLIKYVNGKVVDSCWQHSNY